MTLNLASRLAVLTSVTDIENLRHLEDIVKSIDPPIADPADREALFRLYERFPDDDAFGLFFAILHKLEASGGYQAELVRSVRRQPMEFNLEMVARLLRVGVSHVGSVDLRSLLAEVAEGKGKRVAARKFASETLQSLHKGGA